MGSYVPNSQQERQEMLEFLGVKTIDDLFVSVPDNVKLQNSLNIPEGKSELEVYHMMSSIADKNKVYKTIFRGAGAYHHYIPAAVKNIASKERFITAYTPYQAEISQGILQSIFEFQTMICMLTGMDSANASIYDGASAAAEACAMCIERKRIKVYVSAASHPDTIKTIETYCYGAERQMVLIPEKDGVTDIDALKNIVDAECACVYIQQPNYYGNIEQADVIGEIVHNAGAKYIIGMNPFAMTVLKNPAQWGADIAVGEGQPLGIPLGFGGPYLGFMACTEKLTRKLPGRIVGETVDVDGKRAYVLTLQAREQHIRREKASSNVCSNQALCALTAGAYMAVMGGRGLQEAAIQCMSKANYAKEKISSLKGFELKYSAPTFHEFVTACPVCPHDLTEKLGEKGILGGLPLADGSILWCVTEMNTKSDIDALIHILEEVQR